jgi:O-antigen/teichoic acid export membrane protein
MVLFSSFVVAGALAASVWYLRDAIGQDLAIVFWIACFILPINAQLRVNEASLRGFLRVVRAQVPQAIVRPVALGVAVLLAFLVIGYPPTAAGAMTLNLVTAAATLCLAWNWMFQATPKSTRNVPMETKRRDWARIAVPLLLVAGFHALMRRLDILMLGALVGTSEAGIYSVASRIADLVTFGLVAANTIMAPIISDLYSRNKLAELQRVLALAAASVSAFTILVAPGIVMFGNTALQIFGQDFTLGYSALAILVVGQTINGLVGPVGYLMTMTGHQNIVARVTGLGATLNGILNFVLIPVYGMEGAAIATTVTMIIWNFVMVWYVWSNLRLSPTVFSIFTLVR